MRDNIVQEAYVQFEGFCQIEQTFVWKVGKRENVYSSVGARLDIQEQGSILFNVNSSENGEWPFYSHRLDQRILPFSSSWNVIQIIWKRMVKIR